MYGLRREAGGGGRGDLTLVGMCPGVGVPRLVSLLLAERKEDGVSRVSNMIRK